jgi:RraA family protein
MANLGFRIIKDIKRPNKELIEKFRDLPVANLGDNMNRIACLEMGIKPYSTPKLLGCAFTVKAPEGDNLMFHKALDLAQEGDVLIIAGGGSTTRSYCGEMMMQYAKYKKLGGVIVDGCIRDAEGIRNLEFPVYAKGVQPNGPYKNGPGEINVPVSCGGQVIFPGDIIVGDEDGIIVIRPDEAEEVAKKTMELNEKEAIGIENIKLGKFDRPWIDQFLKEKGCEIL